MKPAEAGGIGMGTERIIPQPANCGLGDLHYVIERVMNVYQPVLPVEKLCVPLPPKCINPDIGNQGVT